MKETKFPVTITFKINFNTKKRVESPWFQNERFSFLRTYRWYTFAYIFPRTKEHTDGANMGPQISVETWSAWAPLLQYNPTKKLYFFCTHGNHLVGSCFPPKSPCASASNWETCLTQQMPSPSWLFSKEGVPVLTWVHAVQTKTSATSFQRSQSNQDLLDH